MKLKKDLLSLVKTDYVPLQADKEGLLRGGFGTMSTGIGDIDIDLNVPCKNRKCTNGTCPNPSCQNDCTVNYCSPSTASPSPSPSTVNAAAFLLGF